LESFAGYAVPERNADKEYDEVLDEIAELEGELEEYLKVKNRNL
jgi:hypothetical protein